PEDLDPPPHRPGGARALRPGRLPAGTVHPTAQHGDRLARQRIRGRGGDAARAAFPRAGGTVMTMRQGRATPDTTMDEKMTMNRVRTGGARALLALVAVGTVAGACSVAPAQTPDDA